MRIELEQSWPNPKFEGDPRYHLFSQGSDDPAAICSNSVKQCDQRVYSTLSIFIEAYISPNIVLQTYYL